MKKNYTTPDVQCVLLSSADVITASVIGLEEISFQSYMDSFSADR